MFSAHSSLFQYSSEMSTKVAVCISSDHFQSGLMELFPAMRRKSAVIGTCTIPERVSKVRIKTTGLQAYFYNENFWIRIGEINGTTSV